MKSTEEIVRLLDKKIEEHKTVIEDMSEDLKKMKKDGKIESAYKHMILKDKLMFHKAAILALKDVKNEIQT